MEMEIWIIEGNRYKFMKEGSHIIRNYILTEFRLNFEGWKEKYKQHVIVEIKNSLFFSPLEKEIIIKKLKGE